jgi:glycosyltransferase involved in cell wall biosynthesis
MLNWTKPEIVSNTQPLLAKGADLRVRKMIGRCHLNSSRFEEAFGLYACILLDYPEDLEATQVLADLYLLGGNKRMAEQLYHRVLQFDPNNSTVKERLQKCRDQAVNSSISDPTLSFDQMIQNLTGPTGTPTEEQVSRAASLLEEILSCLSPAEKVAQHLDEIDTLLPALIELNIRQARASGRPDIAEGLHQLQLNIALQLRETRPNPATTHSLPRIQVQRFKGKIQLLVNNPAELSSRMALTVEALSSAGCEISTNQESSLISQNKPDIILAANPHLSTRTMESLAMYSAAGVPVFVDLDTDFEHLPTSHATYKTGGLNNPIISRAYTSALLLSSQITVPTKIVAQSLNDSGFSACVVPDGWSKKNSLWEQPAPRRDKINIGWVGTYGQIEDLALIRRIILRVLREFSDTQLVIVGDLNAYQLFENIPENRRLYLPQVAPEDFPNLLNQIDILLLPLRNIPFNCSLTDQPLVEVGVKRIPWAGSALPWITAWKAGGLEAETLDEWHSNLRQMILDPELRLTLGEAGRRQAETREADQLAQTWLTQIEEVISRTVS